MKTTKNRRKWTLCGVASAAFLLASGVNDQALAQSGQEGSVQVPSAQNARNAKPNLTFIDATGIVKLKSSDLRKIDPFYQLLEQHYMENRITETEFKTLMQKRVDSLGSLCSKIDREIGRMSPDQLLKLTNGFMESGGKFVDAIHSDTSTSAEMAGSLVDTLPAALQFNKDAMQLLTPALEDYFNDVSSLAGAYDSVVQSHPEAFSVSERRKVSSDTVSIQSHIRLSIPSRMGTQSRKLDAAIIDVNDPAKQQKMKTSITQAIDSHGGAQVFRRSMRAAESGDPLEIAASQVEMGLAAAVNALANHNPIYDEPEQGQPTPVPASTTRRPVKVGTYHGQDPYAGLYVPQSQTQEPIPAPKPVPKPIPKPVPKKVTQRVDLTPVQLNQLGPLNDLQQSAVRQMQEDAAAAHPTTGHRPGGGGALGGSGSSLTSLGLDDNDPNLIAYDSAFTLEDLSDETASFQNASPSTYRPPRQPVYHGPDPQGGFTPSAMNGYFEMPDGEVVAANSDRSLPEGALAQHQPHRAFTLEDNLADDTQSQAPTRTYAAHVPPSEPTFHAGDGSFTREGQYGYYELPDGTLVIADANHDLPPPESRTVLGNTSGTYDRVGDELADSDSDFDIDRLSDNQARSARDGDFSEADAFEAAMAAMSDAIDANASRIERESDDALDAWDRYADQVWYDEEGNIHQASSPRRVNDYVAPDRDERSATQIDGDRNQNNPWGDFEPSDIGAGLEVADLEAIYAGYDIDTIAQGSSGRSLSSAGNSLSSAGTSLGFDMELPAFGPTTAQLAFDRANGLLLGAANEWHAPTEWSSDDLGDHSILVNGSGRSTDPALASLYDLRDQGGYDALYGALHGDSMWSGRPLAETSRDLANALYGPLWSDRPYMLQANAGRDWGGFTSGLDVATLSGLTPSQMRALTANDVNGGLDRLLAQPFNVLLTWGEGSYDLDLHMTGPLAEGSADRFHIYFSAPGALDKSPFAALIKDCICKSGSEVILTSALIRGQVYRISVFNYGDQSATSSNLSSASNAILQIVRGGFAQSVGSGTTIVGGHVIYTGTPTPGQAGNTWLAVEIDPNTGRIRAPDSILQSSGSNNVH